MLENINAVIAGKIDLDFSSLWFKYKEDAVDAFRHGSRAYDDFGVAFESFFSQFDLINTSRLYRLNSPECREVLPEDVYGEFCSVAEAEDFWAETPYSWDNTAMVVATDYSQSQQHGMYILTDWSNNSAYNTSGYNSLGCVTIAVGRLMKHFRYPENLPWEKMRNAIYASHQCPELTDFLKQLRSDLNISEDGEGTIDDAKRVLEEYGYSVELVDNDVIKFMSALREKPILACGQDRYYNPGHSWIIDGYKLESSDVTEYTLYRLHDAAYPQFAYNTTEPVMQWQDTNNPIPPVEYLMRWGYEYGAMDGWYTDWIIPELGMDFNAHRKCY